MRRFFNIFGRNILIDAPGLCLNDDLMSPFECGECIPDISFICEKKDSLTDFGCDGNVFECDDGIHRRNVIDGLGETHSVYSKGLCRVCIPSEGYEYYTGNSYLWHSISFTHTVIFSSILSFHASYIAYNGKAVLFTAPSGTGKSTQAFLWRDNMNAEIINGDKAGVSVNGSEITAHGVPYCGTSGICNNKSFPLGAIVVLGQSQTNSVRRISAADSIKLLMSNVYADLSLSSEFVKITELLINIVSAVPVYGLDCTPDIKAVETLAEKLTSDGVL